MSEQLQVPMVDLQTVQIDAETLKSLPPKLVYRKKSFRSSGTTAR